MHNLPDEDWNAEQLDAVRQLITATYGGESKAALNYQLGKMSAHAIAIGMAMGAREQADRIRREVAAGEVKGGPD